MANHKSTNKPIMHCHSFMVQDVVLMQLLLWQVQLYSGAMCISTPDNRDHKPRM